MKLIKIGAAVIGVLLIAAVALAAYGFPARELIKTYSRDALAKNELELDIGGNASVVIWPSAGITVDDVRLRDPQGRDDLVTVERVHAGLSLIDLLRGRIRIDEIALTRPVVRTESMFERAKRMAARRASSAPGATAPIILPGAHSSVMIDAISATDGLMVLRDGRETAELRFDDLRLATMAAAAGRSSLHLSLRSGDNKVRLVAGLDDPTQLADGQPISVDATIDAPAALKSPVSVTAMITKAGPVIKVDGLNGTIDQGRVRGSMSISFAGAKPFLDATLQSERIDLTNVIDKVTNTEPAVRSETGNSVVAPERDRAGQRGGAVRNTPAPAEAARPERPWSDKPLNFFGLRLVEASINLSAREVVLDTARVAPAAIEATLLHDTLTVKLAPSGVYGGQATGELTVDRAQETPALAMRMAFSGIDALPLLRDINGFNYVSGRARGAVDLKASGTSPLRIVSGLNGRGEFLLEDGAVRGLNMPGMVRSLLDMILSGWQPRASEETRFNSFGGTFVVDKGVARTTDIKFNGPLLTMTAAGSVDLRAQTLDFRADPRILSSRDPSSGRQTSSGIGVPVVVNGPWSRPRIYADTPDILSNTDAALRALRSALGAGGGSGGSGSDTSSSGAPSGTSLNEFIDGLSKGFGQSTGDPARDGGKIAEELLKALGGSRSATVPPPEPTAPRTEAAPPRTQAPRSTPAPAPDRELDRGAREILRDLLGR